MLYTKGDCGHLNLNAKRLIGILNCEASGFAEMELGRERRGGK